MGEQKYVYEIDDKKIYLNLNMYLFVIFLKEKIYFKNHK